MVRKYSIVFVLLCSICFSQTYPIDENIMESVWEDYQPPTNTPKYLVPFLNEQGNEITRISDAGVFGTTGQNLRHHYSLDQPWNSDGTLIKLAGYPAAILDGKTYKFLYWRNIPSSATWSNIDPLKMYGTSGKSIVSYNVVTNVRTTLKTFLQYEEIDYGINKGNITNNDKYMPILGKASGVIELIVFDLKLNKVHAQVSLPSQPNWITISPLGNYAVAHYSFSRVDVYDIDLTQAPRAITNYTTHSDFGIDSFGNEVYIAFGDLETRPNDYYMKMVRLSDGVTTPLFYHPNGYGVWSGHISARNINRPGWAYVSEGCCETIGKKEIFAIKLDGSNTIERFGYHHATYKDSYQQEPHAVPNRDGTKIMFASSWNGLFITEYPPAFIVEKK
ncbi:YncE family protein [Xanthomarina spongicola]|uniref:WD40 repeat protein n=1 Tax=Xanthomarina spongicola TaxID=570520 RepID=A0A316DIC9_9FLAO|nr:hypothetical protein [Xanthomarina spongicola]PWK17272.1 hypothetical protein LX78_02812 [Xanthomarina spongicola]